MIENEAPAAIGAIDLAARPELKIDERVAQRPHATVAADGRGFHMYNFGWLHQGLSNDWGSGGLRTGAASDGPIDRTPGG